MFVDDATVTPITPGFIGVATKETRELDDKRETQSRDLLDDTSGGARRRNIVNDYIAQFIKSRDVNPEQTIQARRWKWYDDVAAAVGGALFLGIRRDVNPEMVARRDALDDYIN